MNGDTNCNLHTRCSQERMDTGTGALGNERTSGGHTNDRIINIG